VVGGAGGGRLRLKIVPHKKKEQPMSIFLASPSSAPEMGESC
jgi:hypothetical protein